MIEQIQYSKYQEAIFEQTGLGKRNILVKASAGSSKTSSLIKSLDSLESNLTWFITSFGKQIVSEIENKVKEKDLISKGREVKNIHSFGLKCLYKTFGKDVTVDNDKLYTLYDKTLGKKLKNKELPYQLVEACKKCKLALSLSKDEIKETIERFDIDLLNLDESEFINHVQFLLNLDKKFKNIVDFEDMVWLHNVLPTKILQFDRVFIDEFQDFSKCELEFLFKIVKNDGKCYAYGDPYQAIYYWKSADPESFSRFESKFDPLILKLPISYRCPIEVINLAKKYNPDIEAWEKAKQGKIEEISMNEMFKLASPGCFILSRYNAPIVSIAMKLVGQKRPCNIQGKDLGDNLLAIIKRSKTKSIESFLEYLEKWKKKEVAKVMAMKKDSSNILDKYNCFLALAQGSSNLEQMKSNIDNLFYDGDDKDRIILGSIHSCKGMQREYVFVLQDTLRNFNQEELNIAYVAYSRCSFHLFLVKNEKKNKLVSE